MSVPDLRSLVKEWGIYHRNCTQNPHCPEFVSLLFLDSLLVIIDKAFPDLELELPLKTTIESFKHLEGGPNESGLQILIMILKFQYYGEALEDDPSYQALDFTTLRPHIENFAQTLLEKSRGQFLQMNATWWPLYLELLCLGETHSHHPMYGPVEDLIKWTTGVEESGNLVLYALKSAAMALEVYKASNSIQENLVPTRPPSSELHSPAEVPTESFVSGDTIPNTTVAEDSVAGDPVSADPVIGCGTVPTDHTATIPESLSTHTHGSLGRDVPRYVNYKPSNAQLINEF